MPISPLTPAAQVPWPLSPRSGSWAGLPAFCVSILTEEVDRRTTAWYWYVRTGTEVNRKG